MEAKGWTILTLSAVGTIAAIASGIYYYNNVGFYIRYDAMSAEKKLAGLWDKLVPNEKVVEGPTPLKWSDFDDIFT